MKKYKAVTNFSPFPLRIQTDILRDLVIIVDDTLILHRMKEGNWEDMGG